jgi:3'-phosphoadenosine 5'-phosphosulfate sulfotransferase (PAPS reductase)/FAD synthetase
MNLDNGTQTSTTRDLELFTTDEFKGENVRAFPISNWTELDV